VTFNVDARINVPSGIHVYGEGFDQAGMACTLYGTFSIPPGKAKTIYINIKGDKTEEIKLDLRQWLRSPDY
jgi:homoserine kinase